MQFKANLINQCYKAYIKQSLKNTPSCKLRQRAPPLYQNSRRYSQNMMKRDDATQIIILFLHHVIQHRSDQTALHSTHQMSLENALSYKFRQRAPPMDQDSWRYDNNMMKIEMQQKQFILFLHVMIQCQSDQLMLHNTHQMDREITVSYKFTRASSTDQNSWRHDLSRK
jgi:hypothetical protein